MISLKYSYFINIFCYRVNIVGAVYMILLANHSNFNLIICAFHFNSTIIIYTIPYALIMQFAFSLFVLCIFLLVENLEFWLLKLQISIKKFLLQILAIFGCYIFIPCLLSFLSVSIKRMFIFAPARID